MGLCILKNMYSYLTYWDLITCENLGVCWVQAANIYKVQHYCLFERSSQEE